MVPDTFSYPPGGSGVDWLESGAGNGTLLSGSGTNELDGSAANHANYRNSFERRAA